MSRATLLAMVIGPRHELVLKIKLDPVWDTAVQTVSIR